MPHNCSDAVAGRASLRSRAETETIVKGIAWCQSTAWISLALMPVPHDGTVLTNRSSNTA
jgi:hypothetical protein